MPIYKRKNENFFKTWSPKMAYVLGFFAADGCMMRNKRGAHYIEFHITDRCLLVEIRNAMDANHVISSKKRIKDHKPIHKLQIGSKELFNDLTRLGFTERKSKKMIMPRVPKKYLNHFVRGYFDGDGNVYANEYKRKGRQKKSITLLTGFTCGSQNFLKSMRAKLSKNACLVGGSLFERNGCYRLYYSVNDSCKLYRFMYNTESNIFLDRKKIIFEKYFKRLGIKI